VAHAVIVRFPLSDDGFGSDAEFNAMVALSDALEAAITAAGVGEFDGNELGGGECTLFMYGPDAHQLFSAVLAGSRLVRGVYVVKRYGDAHDPLAQETTLPL
jgi:hypothetical protein